ncbi:MAG: redoxin domain-containing protein [Planctomycetota bacterium]
MAKAKKKTAKSNAGKAAKKQAPSKKKPTAKKSATKKSAASSAKTSKKAGKKPTGTKKKVAPKKLTTKKVAAKKTAKKPAKPKANLKAKTTRQTGRSAPVTTSDSLLIAASSRQPAAVALAPELHSAVGRQLPALTLNNQRGEAVHLHDLAQRAGRLVLYFYPKDDTPGCTTEACDFRDQHSRVLATGAMIVGVSPDDTESHASFAGKYQLRFDLLADTQHELADALGVWKLKEFSGRQFHGVERATFIVDQDARVLRGWQPVKVDGHVQQIVDELERLPMTSGETALATASAGGGNGDALNDFFKT